jgi:hypothetical protein
MNRWLGRPTKMTLALLVILYSAYLLKTLLGINISGRYSASHIFKAPLDPFFSHGTALCEEFQTLCNLRSKIQFKVQRRIERLREEV